MDGFGGHVQIFNFHLHFPKIVCLGRCQSPRISLFLSLKKQTVFKSSFRYKVNLTRRVQFHTPLAPTQAQ